jgi:glycosyl transferase family 25
MKLLQHILYINLEHRTDRKEYLLKQIDQLNQIIEEEKWGDSIHPERFPAIQHDFGALGCSMSHLEALKLAKERDWPYACFLEDDVLFTDPKLFLSQLYRFEQEFDQEWDVLVLGGNNKKPYREVNDYCIRVLDLQTSTAYIVQKHYYDTLIQNMSESIEQLSKHPLRRYAYSLDIYWKRLQRSGNWLMIKPLSITQLEGYSDVEKKNVNYNDDLLNIERVYKPPLNRQLKK